MVIAVTRVKDEADIIEATIRRMAAQVDRVIVADNGSTDGTREILDRLPVEVLDDTEIGYYQSAAMTSLADLARLHGADWVIPFDADEVWLPRHGGRLADTLMRLDPGVLVAEAPLFDHVCTSEDPQHADPVARIGWRRAEAAPLRKVAVRALAGVVIHQGNHSAEFPGVTHPPTVTNAIEIRHFPYRSPEQMIRKARNGAAAYAATDLPEHVGAHWRQYGRLSDAELHEVFHTFFFRDQPGMPVKIGRERQPPLVHDPA